MDPKGTLMKKHKEKCLPHRIINMRNHRKCILKNKQSEIDAEDVQKRIRVQVLDLYVKVLSFRKLNKSEWIFCYWILESRPHWFVQNAEK